jgi:DNA repair exonuclease SbcCD ATPase subunit
MSKDLSQIVADLFARSSGGEELSSNINRLRDEIRKVTEREDAIFGKFRELLVSFREIIPEEKQRYNAAIKALSTTSKLSRQEIVKTVNDQLEELKILEKSILPALPGRSELKVMEARSKEMKDGISNLREKIKQLESEEERIRKDMAAREKEMELVEKAIRDLFTDIGAEITNAKKKIEEFTAEHAAVQPIPQKDAVKSDVPGEKKGGGEQKIEIQGSPAPQDSEFQKKCPMCGGRINFHALEKMWICYSCAYEEPDKDEVQSKSEVKSEQGNAADSDSIFPSSSFTVPLAEMSSDEHQKSKKRSSPSNKQPSTKTKTCPSCRKNMYWYPEERAWRCSSCEYMTRTLN